jgi:serine/threonine protein kinase
MASPRPPPKPEPARCQNCGKDVSNEIGQGRRGDYVCEACRKQAEGDPIVLLEQMLRQAGVLRDADKGMKIPGYEIEKRLGVGGFGAVYQARRKKDGVRTAVKVMLSKIAVDEKSRKQFLAEIEKNKALQHAHVVRFLEHGAAGNGFYFVMEFCEGGSVADLMGQRGGKLALSEAGPMVLEALEGLAFAHGKGFVHRDLKPHNLLLTGTGRCWTTKVGDFGLAKDFQRAGYSGNTITGSYSGTPYFMPREQVVNYKYMKPVSDVWSMGATLYNMVTGQFPRDFPRGQEPVQIVLQGSIVPIRQRDPSIPRKVAEVIERALTNDVKERYQDANDLRKALASAL